VAGKLRASEDRSSTLFASIDQGFCTVEVLFAANRVFYADAEDGHWLVAKGYESGVDPLPDQTRPAVGRLTQASSC
jgi:hypothetical protein